MKREPLAQTPPRALSEEQQRALLWAAEASRARDRAIVVLLNQTVSGVRVRSKIVPAVGEVRSPQAEHSNRSSASRQPPACPQPARPATHSERRYVKTRADA